MKINGAITFTALAVMGLGHALAMVTLYPLGLLFQGLWWVHERLEPEYGAWRTWFAWRPITLPASGDIVWLEKLQVTKFRGYDYYRRFGDVSVPMPEDEDDG